MAEKRSGDPVKCPECGSECLNTHVGNSGKLYFSCLSCDPGCRNLFTKENSG